MKSVITILAAYQFCLLPLFCQAQEDAGIPAKFTSNVGQLVGQWTTKGTNDGEKFEGTYSAAWNPDQTCLLLASSKGKSKFNGIGGWDPATDEYVETWYRADGFRFELRFKLDSRKSWPGNVIMSTPDGKQESGTMVLKFREDGSFDFKGQAGTSVLIQTSWRTADKTLTHSTNKTSTRSTEKTSTRADFEEFVKQYRGRWVGQVKWIADWKGVGGKKGDTATVHVEVKTLSDGNLLYGQWYGGDGSGSWLVFYDAGDKLIRDVWIDSAGLVQRAVYWKDGSDWKFETIGGSQADGSRLNATGTVKITDGGKQHTWTSTTTIDGKPADPQKDIYRRITDR